MTPYLLKTIIQNTSLADARKVYILGCGFGVDWEMGARQLYFASTTKHLLHMTFDYSMPASMQEQQQRTPGKGILQMILVQSGSP